MPAPATAVDQQIVWKNNEMMAFAVALVKHARALGNDAEFTTDIVPEDARGDGRGIAGSVIELLKNAHVIEPVGIMHRGIWYPKREISKRASSKSRYLNFYKLCSPEIAYEFLRRHPLPAAPEPKIATQTELLPV